MVLEEVSSNADTFGSEPIPNNDSDPFASQAPSDVQITLDLNTLPKPVPIVGWIVGYGTQARANRLHQSLQQVQSVLKRPLRQEEANAIAHTYSQIMATSSWGDALGLAAGGYQSYRTAHYFRFPFWTPNPEIFTPDQLGPFRGGQARILWHSMRTVPYLLMGAFVGDLFFRNYATINAAIGMRKDERLADFNRALEGVMQKQIDDTTQRRQRNRPLPESQQREREGLAGGPAAPRRGKAVATADDSDDASPTGGAFVDTYGDRAGTGMLSDSQVRASEAQRSSDNAAYDPRYENQQRAQRQQDSRYATESNSSSSSNKSPRTQPPSREDRNDSFDLGTSDPSSPQQGTLPSWAQNRNATQPSSRSGSSWDRLRQQAQGGGAAVASSQEQRQGSTVGDGFSFSSSDEERQLAKGEAQREFDRRLERERQGKDFDDGSKRW